MKTPTALLALTAAAFAFTASAGEMGKTSTFEALDKDSNGKISATEARAHDGLNKSFAQTDRNADGAVDASEFKGYTDSARSTAMPSEKATDVTPKPQP